jgi:hypothetical protein
MTRHVLSALAIAALIGVAPVAHAGFKSSFGVTTDPVSRYANGTMGSARASADAVQYMSCYATYASSAGAFCVARDAAGTTVSCFTSDPNKVAIVSAMTSYSYVYFSYDASGTCTQILVQNSSYYPPMVP